MLNQIISKHKVFIDNIGKVLCPKNISWGIYLLFAIGYWRYQHCLIVDSYSAYGISELTLICFLLIMSLLPVSISRRLKVKESVYPLAFLPSLLAMALVANETISIVSAIISVFLVGVAIIVIAKKPALKCDTVATTLVTWIIMLLTHFLIANTDEVTHYKHLVTKHIAAGEYEEALEVGKKSQSVDSTLFNLRSYAMMQQNTLSSKLFNYPMPKMPRLNINMATNEKQMQEIILCNLLLDKNLNTFIEVLKRYYPKQLTPPASIGKLPVHFQEGVYVYNSLSTSPIVSNTESNVAINYSDFTAERRKQDDSLTVKKQCKRLYDDTFFYYYFYM